MPIISLFKPKMGILKYIAAIVHLFTECAQATLFWKEFLDWASRMVNSKLSLSIKEIMFGIINNDSKFCLALNHLVIIGKYFLYVKALNSKFYIFHELFVSLARDKLSPEKYISCTTGRKKEFRTKWSAFFVSFKYSMKFCLLNWLCSHLILVTGTSNIFIVLGFFFVSFKL